MNRAQKRKFLHELGCIVHVPLRWRQTVNACKVLNRNGWLWNYETEVFEKVYDKHDMEVD